MGTKILKFIGIIVAIELLNSYVPYGPLICVGVILIALWNLVNQK